MVTGDLPVPKITSPSSSTPTQQESIQRNVIVQLNIRGEKVEYEETTDVRKGFLKEDVERQCLKSTGNETERDINITTDILISMSVMKV